MKDLLRKIHKIVQALTKLIPTLIEVIEDLADDGKLNNSNTKAPK
jgi:hypothetical protein